MNIKKEKVEAIGIKFYIEYDGKEIARTYLYIANNSLHKEPFGLLEDVFVEKTKRGKNYGTLLVNRVIEEARKLGCYKLIATSRHSRPKVHEWYKKLGFEEQGLEFRMNFS